MVIDRMMYRKAESPGEAEWGKMPVRSQYALLLMAVSFTWLMGLMGYARSGIRQHWHVYTIFRDYSVNAFTPTLGFAAIMVTKITLVFLAMVIFIFWLDWLSRKKKEAKD